MQKIRNLTTKKSSKQHEDFLVASKAKKKFFLQSTDWSQLDDIEVDNIDEINEWRRKLREFSIDPNLSDEENERRLDKLVKNQPKIIAKTAVEKEPSSTPQRKSEEEIEKNIKSSVMLELLEEFKDEFSQSNKDEKVELTHLDYNNALIKALELFNEYKSQELLQNGIIEYNLKKILLEEAVDKKLSEDVNTPLLDEHNKEHTKEDLEEIIENCKQYFNKINKLYSNLNKYERSFYNMSIKELNEWFEENGYRYRCKD